MIDTDKYKTKKNRNWELKVTIPYEDIIAVDSLGKESYTVAQMVDTGLEDAQLIADAPLLLAEVKRLREAIADVATNMEAADASYMGGFIEDLWKVIE